MALTVTTPAADTKLTTPERVVEEVDGIADPLLTELIEQASAIIVAYCDRPFAQEVYSETLPGFGDVELMVSRTPIIGTPTVFHNGDPIIDFTIESPEAGILRRDNGWSWTAPFFQHLVGHPIAGAEDPQFTVNYTAGYILPDDQANRTLPLDIERAAIELVRATYLSRTRDPAVVSERVGDYAVTYARPGEEPESGLPPRVEALLTRWKRYA